MLPGLLATGCVSLGGAGPQTPAARVPASSRARCAEYHLTHSATFNDDEDSDDSAPDEHDEERRAIAQVVDDMVLQTGLVGFVGQEGLDGTSLSIDVRRDVSASILHGVGAALTLFVVPFWVEVTYEVRADLHGTEDHSSTSTARESWYVLVNPFLAFAMPFDEPARPLELVRELTRRVLSDLVAQEGQRDGEHD